MENSGEKTPKKKGTHQNAQPVAALKIALQLLLHSRFLLIAELNPLIFPQQLAQHTVSSGILLY